MSLAPEDVALIKRQCETMIEEYAREIAAYDAFMKGWRELNPPQRHAEQAAAE